MFIDLPVHHVQHSKLGHVFIQAYCPAYTQKGFLSISCTLATQIFRNELRFLREKDFERVQTSLCSLYLRLHLLRTYDTILLRHGPRSG